MILDVETKSLLLGDAASPESQRAIEGALNGTPGVDRIIHMKTLYLGPDELMVAMKVAVQTSKSATDVANAINAVEERVRAAVPIARVLYIEPDIFHPEQADAVAGAQVTARDTH